MIRPERHQGQPESVSLVSLRQSGLCGILEPDPSHLNPVETSKKELHETSVALLKSMDGFGEVFMQNLDNDKNLEIDSFLEKAPQDTCKRKLWKHIITFQTGVGDRDKPLDEIEEFEQTGAATIKEKILFRPVDPWTS